MCFRRMREDMENTSERRRKAKRPSLNIPSTVSAGQRTMAPKCQGQTRETVRRHNLEVLIKARVGGQSQPEKNVPFPSGIVSWHHQEPEIQQL